MYASKVLNCDLGVAVSLHFTILWEIIDRCDQCRCIMAANTSKTVVKCYRRKLFLKTLDASL